MIKYFSPLTNECLTSCPNGYYKNTSNNICIACYGTCASCTGPTSTECTGCSGSFYLNSTGECLPTCPDG